MKEGIAARVGRILSGGFNQLVDALENAAPETVMEEAVREVDSAIDDVRAELGRILANKHLASKRLMDASTRHEDLTDKIDLAIKEGRDDLAEAAVAQQLDLEAQMPVLERTINDAAEEEHELEGFVAALQARKRQMKDELSEFRRSRAEAAAAAGDSPTAGGSAGRSHRVQSKADKAGSAFDRVLEKQTGLASGDTSLKRSGQLAELEDMHRRNRIQERLAAAKAKVENDGEAKG